MYKADGDKSGIVTHEFINEILIGQYRNINIPHEWYFLNLLIREEIKKDIEIVWIFYKFVRKFYPEYKWYLPVNDTMLLDELLSIIVVETSLWDYQFKQYSRKLKTKAELDPRAMQFGEIVTDFLIRYSNYSLVNFSGDGIILTAQSDCEKRFIDYLNRGFKLHRVSKLYFADGKFYKLPVFPTKDIGLNISEVIESSDGEYRPVPSYTKHL